MRFIDLGHTFCVDMPCHPVDKTPSLKQIKNVSDHGFASCWLASGMHVGTHLDAPGHFIAGGAMVSDLALERFVGRGVLIDARGHAEIDCDVLESVVLARGDMVLVWTGYDTHFLMQDYFTHHPVITEAFAQKLIDAGANAVGIDAPSPDKVPHALHHLLLSNGVLIIENLTCLVQLAAVKNFVVYAFPPKFAAEGSFVRVVAQSTD